MPRTGAEDTGPTARPRAALAASGGSRAGARYRRSDRPARRVRTWESVRSTLPGTRDRTCHRRSSRSTSSSDGSRRSRRRGVRSSAPRRGSNGVSGPPWPRPGRSPRGVGIAGLPRRPRAGDRDPCRLGWGPRERAHEAQEELRGKGQPKEMDPGRRPDRRIARSDDDELRIRKLPPDPRAGGGRVRRVRCGDDQGRSARGPRGLGRELREPPDVPAAEVVRSEQVPDRAGEARGLRDDEDLASRHDPRSWGPVRITRSSIGLERIAVNPASWTAEILPGRIAEQVTTMTVVEVASTEHAMGQTLRGRRPHGKAGGARA